MSLSPIREQIKVISQGVSGVGVVHDRHRFAADTNKMLNLFRDATGKINTIMFRREKMAKRLTGGSPEKAHVFLFLAIMGLQDDKDSGIAFDDLLTAFEEAFEDHDDLNGTCLTTRSIDWGPMAGMDGIQIDLVDERMFGNVLCHYAELRLCAIEYQS